MPTNTIAYIRSIFYAPSKITCTMVAAVNGVGSHDRFTRLLTRITWKGQTLLSCLILRCFGNLDDGFLIIDDTVITKHFAKVIECVFWVWSSKEERAVRGINRCIPPDASDTLVVVVGGGGVHLLRKRAGISVRFFKKSTQKRSVLLGENDTLFVHGSVLCV